MKGFQQINLSAV